MGVLCCIAVGGIPLLHCAWLVVRVSVLYCIVVRGNPRTPYSAALGLTAALCFLVRKRAVCIVVGADPEVFLSLSLSAIRTLASTPRYP